MVRAALCQAMLTELTGIVLGELPITKLRFTGPIDFWRFQQPDSRDTHLILEILSRSSRDQSSQTEVRTYPLVNDVDSNPRCMPVHA